MQRLHKFKTARKGCLMCILFFVLTLFSCGAGKDDQGTEYAPNMYHSIAYEPLTQITDEQAGAFVNSLNNGRGEFFNSNVNNPFRMNVRLPAPNTVARNAGGRLPYRGDNSTGEIAASDKLVNPFPDTPAILEEGKLKYDIYCKHCHGANGKGDGPVAEKVAGVANFQGTAYQNITEGRIFHDITFGYGLMQPHASQVSEDDRWKIAKYVKQLQKK